MHRVRWIALAMLLALAWPPRAAAPGGAESELLAADAARSAALQAADARALGRLLGDELSYVHSNAQRQTKAELIAEIASGERRYLGVVTSAARAHAFGDAGVVTADSELEVELHGRHRHVSLRYTATYVRRDGHWVLVAYQSTERPAAAAPPAQPDGTKRSTTPLMQ